MNYLTPFEIRDRIIRFNETRDWSVFNDVPEHQQVCVLYPEVFPSTLKQMKEEHEKEKQQLSAQ